MVVIIFSLQYTTPLIAQTSAYIWYRSKLIPMHETKRAQNQRYMTVIDWNKLSWAVENSTQHS